MQIDKEIKSRFKDDYHRLVVNLMYTNNWVVSKNAKMLKAFDISMQQYNVLRILRGQHPEPAMLSLIQERMLDKSSNATRLVEKLRQKNLVKRKICKDNRRKVDIFITEAGLALLKQADKQMEKNHSAFHELSPEEAQTLNELLDKMRSCVQQEE